MAFAYGRVLEITTIAGAAAAVYANPDATTTFIRGIILHNGNTTAETVILYNVPDNATAVGTAATANEMYYEVMPAYSTTVLEFPAPGIILTTKNDSIQGTTTTASKCTIQLLGATET
jgi:hypothetical protein